MRILERDLFPAFGKLPIRQIKAAHLLAALRGIEKWGARTVAARARFLASEIWRYAVATLRADSDLAASGDGFDVARATAMIPRPISIRHPIDRVFSSCPVLFR